MTMLEEQCFGEREAKESDKGLLHQSEKHEAKHTLFSTKVLFSTKIKNIKYA